MALLSLALGRRLLRLLRAPAMEALERGVFAAGLGIGALSFVPFVLFALGVGRTSVFVGVTIALSLLLLPDMVATLRAVVRFARSVRFPLWWQKVFFALLVTTLLALYARALCPPSYGDALSYHLSASLRYLQAGRFIYLPTLTPTNWPVGVEMLYSWLMALNPASPVAIVQFFYGLLTLAALYLFARRMGGTFAGYVAIGLLMLLDGFSSGGFWDQMTLAIVDAGMTVFTTLAILALHRATITKDREEEAQWNRLSALCIGLAATTKLTGIWAILALLLLRVLLDRRGKRTDWLPRALGYGLIAALVALPYFLKSWVLTGNPLYPMGYAIFGGREWTPQGWPTYKRAHMILNTPPGMSPTPGVLLLSHAVIAAIGIAIGGWMVWATRRSRFAVPAGAAGIFLACVCVGNYFLPRFLMPILPALIVWWASNFRGRERVYAPILCLIALVVTGKMVRGRPNPPLGLAVSVALGRTSQEAFLRSQVPDYPVAEYANAHLPANACILVGTYDYNLIFYHALALWPDRWLQDSLHYKAQARLEADLKRLGVTHLVLNPTYPDHCPQSHYCRQRMEEEPTALAQVAQAHGEKLFSANGNTLYALHWEAPPIRVSHRATDAVHSGVKR